MVDKSTDPYAGFSSPIQTPLSTKQRLEQEGKTLSNISTGQTIAEKGATLPYAGATASAELKGKQADLAAKSAEISGKEADRFNSSTPVKKYVIAIPNFAAALRTQPDKEGDSELVMLAAKIQDPEGSVREGDEHRFNNLQSALEQLPVKFQEQFRGNGGMFTDVTRANIRRFLTSRIRAYNMAYNTERKRAIARVEATNQRFKAQGLPESQLIDPYKEVVGPHFGETYRHDIEAYRNKVTGQQKQGAEGQTVGLAEPLPPGAQIEGEDVKSYRFTPEQTAQADAYKKSKDFTAQGWADMVTNFARNLGVVTPETEEAYKADALSVGRQMEQAKAKGQQLAPGFDYSKADEEATKNAGLITTLGQTAKNLPEAAASMFLGATAIPRDAALSVLTGERFGTLKTFPDLAIELIKSANGEPTGPTVQAFSKMLEDNYGSMANIKRYGVKNPLALASDVSLLLTGGGAAAAKLPGVLGATGEAVRNVGRLVDPLSGMTGLTTEGVPAAYTALKEKAPAAFEGATNIPSDIVGFPSGAGGPAVREATAAGFERGMAGAETPRSISLTENMRTPEKAANKTVEAARAAIDRMSEANYQKYLDNTKSLGINPQPLDFNKVRERMQEIKPEHYDDYLGMSQRPTEHLAWERMNKMVEEYAAQAAENPQLLMPKSIDTFKRNLFDVGSKVTGGFDSKASGIADKAYGAVRGLIAEHDPLYDAAMKSSEEGIQAVKDLEKAFSLGKGRERRVNVDAATRKLQSVWRNNVGSNYNTRVGLADLLEAYDPEGVVRAGGAGQMLSSATPRGLSGAVAGGAILPSAIFNPATLALLPTLVPRVVGEAAYGAGRVAGTGARAAKTLLEATETPRTKLAELYNKYPTAFLGATEAGQLLNQTDREKSQYPIGTEMPSVPVKEDLQLQGLKPGTIMFGGREIEYDPATETFVDTETGERAKSLKEFDMQAKAHGGIMHLMRKYA